MSTPLEKYIERIEAALLVHASVWLEFAPEDKPVAEQVMDKYGERATFMGARKENNHAMIRVVRTATK